MSMLYMSPEFIKREVERLPKLPGWKQILVYALAAEIILFFVASAFVNQRKEDSIDTRLALQRGIWRIGILYIWFPTLRMFARGAQNNWR